MSSIRRPIENMHIAGATGDAAIASITDSSGGTAADAIAANVGKVIVPVFINLAELADGDIVTTLTPGFAGVIDSVDFFTGKAVTTAAKASSLNLEIGTTNLTGGVVALTSANCTPKGVKVAGTAVTAANSFSATDTISIEAASTTTFVEGNGWLVITMTNMEEANAFASLAAKQEAILDALRYQGVIRS